MEHGVSRRQLQLKELKYKYKLFSSKCYLTGGAKDYINDLHKKDSDNLLFPSWTPCNRHGCVYFHFNTNSNNQKTALMMAELEDDSDSVTISILHEEHHLRVRGCLVVAGDHLLHLGGVDRQFDYLNMRQQMDNAKILTLNKVHY